MREVSKYGFFSGPNARKYGPEKTPYSCSEKCFLVRVPANLTNLFQPLDLTVNDAAKAFMKQLFTEWNSQEIW